MTLELNVKTLDDLAIVVKRVVLRSDCTRIFARSKQNFLELVSKLAQGKPIFKYVDGVKNGHYVAFVSDVVAIVFEENGQAPKQKKEDPLSSKYALEKYLDEKYKIGGKIEVQDYSEFYVLVLKDYLGKEVFNGIMKDFPGAEYNSKSRAIHIKKEGV